jgi:hypothetical protein
MNPAETQRKVVYVNILLNTNAVAVAYSKKSYHSKKVPNPLAAVILSIFLSSGFIV